MRRGTAATTVAVLALLLSGTVTSPPGSARAATDGTTTDRLVAVDVAGQVGLPTRSMKTWSAAPVDFDGNGTEDVLVGHHYRGARLWRNRGDGTFRRVAKEAWPVEVPDRHSCAWADVDADGRPDVYCAAGRGLRNYVKGPRRDNELWLQRTPGTFTEVGTRWGVGDPCGRGRSVAFLDANGDARPDLFVGNENPRPVTDDRCDRAADLPDEDSKLFLNVRGRGFRPAPRLWDFADGQGSRCAVVLDVDGDGWEDLFTCREGGTPALYRNRRGDGFVDVTARHRLARQVNDAVATHLGRGTGIDLVTSGPDGFGYHLNRDGRFGPRRPIAATPRGRAVSVAAGDADGDGDTDVFGMVGNGTAGNPDDWIFLNDRLTFARVRVPSAPGAADDVVALDVGGTGRVDFLAMNGYNLDGKGPVQLIRLLAPTGSQ